MDEETRRETSPRRRKGSPTNKQRITCTLTPEVEKRLLGNVKPPQRKQYSGSPPRIESINLKLKSPPKAAANLSKVGSVQNFNKIFTLLEEHTKALRQFSCPDDCDKLFDMVAEVRKQFPSFEYHCRKITKQKKLGAEVNPTSFREYQQFCSTIPFFIERINIFGKNIHGSYVRSFNKTFRNIEQIVNQFAETCYRDPQGRSIMLPYRQYCNEMLKSIEKTINTFSQSPDFSAFDEEELAHFSETMKTFGRFFELELQGLMRGALPPEIRIDGYGAKFHENFVRLVPLITSAPLFLEHFQYILDDLEPLQEATRKIKREIGNESILKKPKVKPEIKVDNDEEEESIEEPLRELMKELDAKVDEDYSYNADRLRACTAKYKEIRRENLEKIAKLQAELDKPKPTPKEVYLQRFDDIRKFKDEIDKKQNEEKDRFMRGVIYSLKGVLKEAHVDSNASYTKQLTQIMGQMEKEIGDYQNIEKQSKESIQKAKEIIAQFYNRPLITEENESLENILKGASDAIEKERHDAATEIESQKSLNNSIKKFLLKTLINDLGAKQSDAESLSCEEMITVIRQSLAKRNDDLRKCRSDSANILADLQKARDEIATSLHTEAKGNDPEEILKEFKGFAESIEAAKNDQVRFEQNTFLFLKKLVNSFAFPVNLPSATRDVINPAMEGISTLLDNPEECAMKLMEAKTGPFGIAAEYRNLALDLCSKLGKCPRSSLEKTPVEELRKAAEGQISNLEAEEAMRGITTLFNEADLQSKSRSEMFKSIAKEVEMSRRVCQTAQTVQTIIGDIEKQISGDDMVFIPKTKQTKKLNETAQKLRDAFVNEKADDVSSPVHGLVRNVIKLVDGLCLQISEGKFSPEETRALFKHQAHLESTIFKLRERLVGAGLSGSSAEEVLDTDNSYGNDEEESESTEKSETEENIKSDDKSSDGTTKSTSSSSDDSDDAF